MCFSKNQLFAAAPNNIFQSGAVPVNEDGRQFLLL